MGNDSVIWLAVRLYASTTAEDREPDDDSSSEGQEADWVQDDDEWSTTAGLPQSIDIGETTWYSPI